MTREEFEYSIKSCGFLIHQGQIYYEESELIKAFEDMGLIEQEPSGDLISRQAVIDVIKSMSNANPSYWNKCDVVDREDLIDEISELPSVKQEPKKGHWIFDEILDKHYYCSECKSMGVDYWDFCPYCGARMVEPQETETWNGYHGQITAPKGTFERIFNDADDDNDI